MKWNNFEESSIELPEKTIEKMIEGFSTATKDLAQLKINIKSDMSRISNNKLGTRFQFEVILTSNLLPDYSFNVFEFGYNVTLYPVRVYFTKAILEELVSKGEQLNSLVLFEEEEKFQKAIEMVFGSQRFMETVSGLMKIAKNQDLPF